MVNGTQINGEASNDLMRDTSEADLATRSKGSRAVYLPRRVSQVLWVESLASRGTGGYHVRGEGTRPTLSSRFDVRNYFLLARKSNAELDFYTLATNLAVETLFCLSSERSPGLSKLVLKV